MAGRQPITRVVGRQFAIVRFVRHFHFGSTHHHGNEQHFLPVDFYRSFLSCRVKVRKVHAVRVCVDLFVPLVGVFRFFGNSTFNGRAALTDGSKD